MGELKRGTNAITTVKRGVNQVQSIYRGATLIWSAAVFLLDAYPSTGAAYSFFKLRAAQTLCKRVRRSSDDLEADIGFNGNYIDEAALLAHCGSSDGFVVKDYDQTGNGRDKIQAAKVNQPKIVTAGVINKVGGFVVQTYNGTSHSMSAPIPVNTAAALNVFNVFTSPTAAASNTASVITWAAGNFNVDTKPLGRFSSTGVFSGEYMFYEARQTTFASGRLGSSTYRRNANQIVLEVDQLLSSGIKLFQNNVEQSLDLSAAGASVTENFSPSARGVVATTMDFSGARSASSTVNLWNPLTELEQIIYLTDQSANRVAIQDLMNSRYAIY